MMAPCKSKLIAALMMLCSVSVSNCRKGQVLSIARAVIRRFLKAADSPFQVCNCALPANHLKINKPVSAVTIAVRSEEHTSELQSRPHLVCRLLLEKKKDTTPDTACRKMESAALT